MLAAESALFARAASPAALEVQQHEGRRDGRRGVAQEVPPTGRECEAEWKILAEAIRFRHLTPPGTRDPVDLPGPVEAAPQGSSHYDGDLFKTAMDLPSAYRCDHGEGDLFQTAMDLASAHRCDHGVSRNSSVTVLDCRGSAHDSLAARPAWGWG